MQNAVEDTRRFHHDISNHFSIVEAFLEGRKTNEASQYLQELIQKEEKKVCTVLYFRKYCGRQHYQLQVKIYF